jgi:transposase-like protein
MSLSNKDIKVLIQWSMYCEEALRRSGHEAGAQAHTETAAMLSALRAENARLREALEQIASCESHFPGDVVSIAQAALEVKP